MDFRETLAKELIIADGAMGTQLQAAGLAAGEAPSFWTLSHPREVMQVHSAYIEAGAQLIISNTFSANDLVLKQTPYTVEKLVFTGVQLARKAAAKSDNPVFVALDVGPLGHFIEPLGDIEEDDALRFFKDQIRTGDAAGADVILVESMIVLNELEIALRAAKEVSTLPLIASVTLDAQGRMLDGSDVVRMCKSIEALGVDALGINCGTGPEDLEPYIRELSTVASVPLLFKPNAGLPTVVNNQAVYSLPPSQFASLLKPLAHDPVSIIGGCCGTSPAHIKALREACNETNQ